MKKELKIKIVGTLLLVIGLSFLINLTKPEKDSSNLLHDWFWVNKTHYMKNNSILFLGDSRVYRGVSTESVKKIFPNQKILNLGYSSGGLNKDVFEFALQLLDTNSSTKIIVLGVTPFSLTTEARKNEHFYQEINRPLAEIIEREYINPFLTYFEPIKLTNYKANLHQVSYFQTFHQNGWVESYKLPENQEEAISIYKNTLSKTELNKNSISEILSFTEKMASKKIRIFAFRPPSTKKMELLENEILNFDENKFKKSFESKGGVWIDIQNRYSYHSYDGSHLHFQSAKKLSAYLAKRINQ